MTFLEAALQILGRERKPLHFKEITEMAVGKKLLTFVGRTPEVTMQTQLTASVKKAPGAPFVRVKPGVFGLLRYPDVVEPEPVPVAVVAPPAPVEKRMHAVILLRRKAAARLDEDVVRAVAVVTVAQRLTRLPAVRPTPRHRKAPGKAKTIPRRLQPPPIANPLRPLCRIPADAHRSHHRPQRLRAPQAQPKARKLPLALMAKALTMR